ncbi:MAG TPA: glycine--tRNA ligase subunit beta [Kofleriaceae bacterium]|jgi:glycyl-tRNA synthetase beta chain|nr:glycine--tRNA ligase subunit beta [Kofleriaceae bacterium]
MSSDLLFEIGCEEIPATMLTRALAELPGLVETRLAGARLAHGGVRVLGTPRRLAMIVDQLADRQPDLNEEIVGPPAGAAFAADGTLTKAGQGFAAKNGVDPAALTRREVAGKKGQYVVAVRSVAGQDTRGLLPELLADVARSITWQKSQRWGWSETTFVRPVQWLVALFGGEIVPLTWAGLTAGRESRGHRFLHNQPVEISSAAAYVDALAKVHVIVDPEARRARVRDELARLERETGLRVRPDEPLLGEVIHLGEYPVGICGEFDPAFLEVPEEIIVAEMRTHQRYFAMEDRDGPRAGKLAHKFATMMATIVKDPAVVQRGNAFVIASRLSDAKFFFSEDKKKSFEQWNDKLAKVVFQAKLGDRAKTIGHKIARLETLVEALAQSAEVDAAAARRAARFCKSDLASSVVGEFPELQGVMGRHYAGYFGEAERVGVAIDEHYWPKGQGAAPPATAEGALVAIADRLDTLVGCFATGLQPTGSADPLGLRRAAIGVLGIMLDRGDRRERWPYNLDSMIEASASTYGDAIAIDPAGLDQLREFFRTRLRGLLVEQGIDAQAVDVAIGIGASNPSDVRVRAGHLANVPPDVRAAFKRIANILDDAKAKGIAPAHGIDINLFISKDGAEARLWEAYRSRRDRLEDGLSKRQYDECFKVLAEIGPDVAAFFDKGGVMVMDPDPKLRDNRLALLNEIHRPFMKIGDFRKLGGAS